jgi:hypothetical protein
MAMHQRHHTRFEYFLTLDHYLKTLRTKPGALRGSLSLFQAEQRLRELFFTHFEKTPKTFVEALLHLRKHQYTITDLQKAIKQCLASCPHHPLSLDKLKILLAQQKDKHNVSVPKTAAHPFTEDIAAHSLAQLQDIQTLICSTP